MGAHLLLIPFLFVAICVTFIIVQSCYQKIKMKAILKKKREAAKISLVNIMQLTNSTLINPSWTKTEKGGYVTMEKGCPGKDKNSQEHSKAGEGKASLNLHSPNMLSSVVTLREEQDSPPPYEDLYDTKGNPYAIMKREQQSHSIFGYCYPSADVNTVTVPDISQHKFSSTVLTDRCTVSEEIFPKSHERDMNITSSSQNPCLLQLPQQSSSSTQKLESDPALERRNSSAVLYL